MAVTGGDEEVGGLYANAVGEGILWSVIRKDAGDRKRSEKVKVKRILF